MGERHCEGEGVTKYAFEWGEGHLRMRLIAAEVSWPALQFSRLYTQDRRRE